MNDETVKLKQDVNWPKRVVIASMIAILIAAGAAVAYIAISNSSPKSKYFQSEINSLEFMKDVFKDQYEPEMAWRNEAKDNPVKSSYTLTFDYDDSNVEFNMFSPAAFINHSSLTLDMEKDAKDKKLSANLNANIGNMDIGDFSFYATDEKIMTEMPFLQEVLLLHADDIGSVLHTLDPEVDPEQKFDLNILFDGPNKFISDEQKAYIQKEYFDLIHEELPEEAFKSSRETVEVNNESIKAEKIEFHLTEQELKEIIVLVIDKMSKDEKLLEIIREMVINQINLGLSFTSISPAMKTEVDMFIAEFESGLNEAKNAIESIVIKNGIKSTIWINKGLIVKRDFKIEVGESDDYLLGLQVDGEQLLQNNEQFFDYDITVSNPVESATFNMSGSFTLNKGKSKDTITLSFEHGSASYTSEETLKDQKREFERTLTFAANVLNDPIEIIWSGNATYDRDKMNSEHELLYEDQGESITLHLAKDAELIKEVNIPDSNLKDLGEMDQMELIHFIEFDLANQFEQWLFGIIGGSFFEF